MPAVYDYVHRVEPDEIDELGHASNVTYVDWMQSAALAHSAAQGWPAPRYRQRGQGWVVRTHTVDYLAPALKDDVVLVRTWVASFRRATSVRRYRFVRKNDGTLLGQAETRWAFVDYASGKPARIPPEIIQAFVVVDDPESAS